MTVTPWSLFDALVRDAPKATPWALADGALRYEPDFGLLSRLLAVPLHLRASSQSGAPAKALDVWLAHELRRAGFDVDEVWPRPSAPRVLPREIALLLATLPVPQREVLAARLSSGVRGVSGSDAKVLGKNYVKQVDVVIAQWQRGPELLVSTKRMDSSFGNNALNRVEESYGDAKNLRGRHPLAALGFLFSLRSTAWDHSPDVAARLLDLLAKLGREDDAYDATAVVAPRYDQTIDAPPQDTADEVDLTGPGDGAVVGDEVTDAPDDEVLAALAQLPAVELRQELVPSVLQPSAFLQTLILAILDRTPVELHRGARALLPAARQQEPTHGSG